MSIISSHNLASYKQVYPVFPTLLAVNAGQSGFMRIVAKTGNSPLLCCGTVRHDPLPDPISRVIFKQSIGAIISAENIYLQFFKAIMSDTVRNIKKKRENICKFVLLFESLKHWEESRVTCTMLARLSSVRVIACLNPSKSPTSARACGEVTSCMPDTKRLACVVPEVYFRECTLHSPLQKSK